MNQSLVSNVSILSSPLYITYGPTHLDTGFSRLRMTSVPLVRSESAAEETLRLNANLILSNATVLDISSRATFVTLTLSYLRQVFFVDREYVYITKHE